LKSREKALRKTEPTIIVRQVMPNIEEQKMNARKWNTTAGNTSVKKVVLSKNDKKLRV
jgi:hypothetical protein